METTTPQVELERDFINKGPQQLRDLDQLSRQFGRSLSEAFAGGIAQGRTFDRVLDGVRQRFIDFSLRAALKPLELLVSSTANSLLQGTLGRAAPFTLGTLGNALSGAFGTSATGQPLNLLASAVGTLPGFASGGIVDGPALFPLGRGAGLLGERGAEAILPLARGPDGRLGVASAGTGRGGTTVNVTIMAQDVESFARSEAQVSAALARAVARGQRGL